MAQKTLEQLPRQTCFDLLKEQKVGRFIFEDEFGPAALPVNYAIAGEDVVFRVEDGSKRRAARTNPVAFEVDHIDYSDKSGWSVLIRGVATEIALEHVPELMERMDGQPPTPWAAGVHNVWVKITPHAVSGRRLGTPFFGLMY
ncbi:MAG TPA: pyridoxamine 5'-phosphate oxidase family protein [Acidimicrobiales bacterium]|nr:pyridoxamine 5'-phosphate oxidase family protein [Acidimicrobiales bacterium]